MFPYFPRSRQRQKKRPYFLFSFVSFQAHIDSEYWAPQELTVDESLLVHAGAHAHLSHVQPAPKSLSRTSVSALSRYHGSQSRWGARDIIEIKMMDEQRFEETSGKNVGSRLWGLTETKASWSESGELKTWDWALLITTGPTSHFSLRALLPTTCTGIATKPKKC